MVNDMNLNNSSDYERGVIGGGARWSVFGAGPDPSSAIGRPCGCRSAAQLAGRPHAGFLSRTGFRRTSSSRSAREVAGYGGTIVHATADSIERGHGPRSSSCWPDGRVV